MSISHCLELRDDDPASRPPEAATISSTARDGPWHRSRSKAGLMCGKIVETCCHKVFTEVPAQVPPSWSRRSFPSSSAWSGGR